MNLFVLMSSMINALPEKHASHELQSHGIILTYIALFPIYSPKN